MNEKQRKRLCALMKKTDTDCGKAMGEEFCKEHNGDCEQCLTDFMRTLFENTDGSKCGWCEKIGCGAYHSKCEYYKAYRQRMDELCAKKKLAISSNYFSIKGKGV